MPRKSSDRSDFRLWPPRAILGCVAPVPLVTLTALAVVILTLSACAPWEIQPDYVAREVPSAAPDLRVGSFNIRYDGIGESRWVWENRRLAVRDTILAENPDILGLQEVTTWDGMEILPSRQIPDLLALLPGYELAGGEPLDDISSSNPILFRSERLTLLNTGVLYFSRDPLTPAAGRFASLTARFARWARFRDNRTSLSFLVVNAHAHPIWPWSRMRAARVLAERVRTLAGDDLLVVVGDLNASASMPSVSTVRRKLGLQDALADVAGGSFHMGKDVFRRGRIDHVLVDASAHVLDAWISHLRPGGLYPSDHFPVFADVRFADRCLTATRGLHLAYDTIVSSRSDTHDSCVGAACRGCSRGCPAVGGFP